MLVYIGTGLSVLTVLISSYSLFVQKVEIKRVILFATIGLFSGTILLLGDRITTIRLPILGEVVAKARQDANEIEKIRDDVLNQSKVIKNILKQAKNLQKDLDELTNEMQHQKVSVGNKFLEEKINTINSEINELEEMRYKILTQLGKALTSEKMMKLQNDDQDLAYKIKKLYKQLKQYSNELKNRENTNELKNIKNE